MHAQDGARARGDRVFDEGCVDVEGRRIDIDKDRLGAAISHRVGGGNKRMTDGNYFVPRANADCKQPKMKRGGAIRYGARVWSTDIRGERCFEGCNRRPLAYPSAKDNA